MGDADGQMYVAGGQECPCCGETRPVTHTYCSYCGELLSAGDGDGGV